MSSIKSALKAIGAAIQASRYDDATQQAQQLLAKDPQNYQANLFLGFALDKQAKLPEAQRAYDAAIKAKPDDAQAWQGLLKLFEKQGNNKVDEYYGAALNLAMIYGKNNDIYKCQDVVDKFIMFARSQGTRQQHKRSLEILLPASPVYPFLEGRIPHPSHTYQKIIDIVEIDEKERMNKVIGERRTRLGAKVNQVTLEVKREIFRDSPLESLYEQVIDWTTDDDLRRQYEEKLLRRCYDALVVLPATQKMEKSNKVEKLAGDMVIIKHPFQLAWDITLEWHDKPLLENMDVGILREYCLFFPHAGLARVLEGFMTSEISPFPLPPPVPQTAPQASNSDSGDEDEGGVDLNAPLTTEDRLLMMIDGMSDAPSSILAHRAMAEYYSFLDEHESVVELTRAGRQVVQQEVQKTGLPFKYALLSLSELLGTALVFYQSPKNHPEAKSLFNEVLSSNATSTAALLGIGLIHEEEEDYPAAIDFLDRARSRDANNVRIRAEAAWVKALNGDYERGQRDLEDCLEAIDGSDLRSRELRAQTHYRIGVCLWNIDTSIEARRDRTGAYAHFLAALKSNLNYAPAYTSLGIFYSDYTKDKKRARKCFQKAFELSAAEVEAAERLARAFADKGEWELVEVVARRVVESGKVGQSPVSKKKAVSWPFSALGVAELNKQDYAKSIVSFQSALRIAPNDYHSWVGLGESYHNSGRYIAATKAFVHAEKFEPDVEQGKSGDVWFGKYMLANVKRELGEYDTAIDGYRHVLQLRPDEVGVSIALTQTLVDCAWDSTSKSLFGQAAELADQAIRSAQGLLINYPNTFNVWKALGDACSVFSWIQGRVANFPHHILESVLTANDAQEAYNVVADIDVVSTDIFLAKGHHSAGEQEGLLLTRCLHAAILCQKQALRAAVHDIHGQAVAYYNLGWTEYRAHVCMSSSSQKNRTRYIKAALYCIKRAIELEAGNAEFWNALGVVASELSPKIAQHSFVRSLYLNERSAQTWTNLGSLCLLQNDYSLANEAFTRAQSTDPDFAHAWLGQGLVALLFGDPKEARLLFTHAMEISDSSSQLVRQQYASSIFDRSLNDTAESSLVDLIQPVLAMNQLSSLTPNDLSCQHLRSLFLERIEDTSAAVAALATICGKIEADYETTESTISLSRFALAKADHARTQLAIGEYEQAVESAETALELSAEDAGNELSSDARRQCRLSAHLTMSLALYHSDRIGSAVESLETAITEAQGNPDCICLLAQMLWATGDEISHVRARDLLFDCVEAHSGHVRSILSLGVIALVDGDTESLDAVTADLQSLRLNKDVVVEEHAMVAELLRAIAALSEDNPSRAALQEVQAEVFLFPNQPHGWTGLADLCGDDHAASMAVKTAIKSVPPRGTLEAVDLSRALAGTAKVVDVQQAIFLTPSSQHGWDALGRCVSRQESL